MNDFKEIRSDLINMLEVLDERLGNITNDEDLPDESTTRAYEDNEALGFFEKTSIEEIEKIKQAISGIDSGTYGICLTCGLVIKKEQLHRNPLSRLCIHCIEKKNGN